MSVGGEIAPRQNSFWQANNSNPVALNALATTSTAIFTQNQVLIGSQYSSIKRAALEIIVNQSSFPNMFLLSTTTNGGDILAGVNIGAATPSAARLGGIFFCGSYDGTNYAVNSAAITATSAELYSSTAAGTYISLATTPSTTISRAEVMRINQNGGVAIGSGFVTTLPPSSGLIVSGQTAIGTSSAFTGTTFTSSSVTQYNSYFEGTQTLDDGTQTVGLYLASVFSPATTSRNAYGAYFNPSFIAGSGKFISIASALYINNIASSNVGTITSLYGLEIGRGSAGTGILDQAAAIYINTPFAAANSANQGLVIFGSDASGNTTGCQYGLYFTGTMTGDDGSNNISFYINPTIQPTNNFINCFGIYAAPYITTHSTNTIAGAYGAFFQLGGSAGSGTITSAYSGYFGAPTVGTNATALYADNFSIGHTSITPPSNGAAIYGATVIGTFASVISGATLTVVGSYAGTAATQCIYTDGTLSATSSSMSLFFGETIAQTASGLVHYTIELDNTIGVSTGNTMTNYCGVRVTPNGGSGTGTITSVRMVSVDGIAAGSGTTSNFYAYYYDGSCFGSTVTTSYAMYLATPNKGTTRNGLWINCGDTLNGAAGTRYGLMIAGNLTGDDGSSTIAQIISVNLNPANNSKNANGIYLSPSFVANSSQTISSAFALEIVPVFSSNVGTISTHYGIYITAGSSLAGTLTNNFGIYVNAPNVGTNKFTAYFDPGVAIGAAVAGQVIAFRVNTSGNANTYYNSTSDGTLVQNDTGSSSGGQIGIGMLNVFNPTLGGGSCSGIYSSASFIAPTTKTISSIYGVYVYNVVSNNIGTITTAYGLLVDSGSTLGGTVTSAYGMYVKNPSAGTTKYTAYMDPGVGIGISIANTHTLRVNAASNANTYNCCYVDGTLVQTSTGTLSGNQIGLGGFNIFNCSLGAGSCYAMIISPTFIAPSSKTISAMYGIYINPTFSSNVGTLGFYYGIYIDSGTSASGTLSTNYGLFVATPAAGTTKICAFFGGPIQFSAVATGSKTATLGTNGPMTTTTPNTWIEVLTPGGSTGYVPVWV